jgi:uncharacterized repeat protein (TIGR03803 family)
MREFGKECITTLASIVFAAGALIATVGVSTAHEYNLHIVHSFCSDVNCRDGQFTYAGLVSDSSANLYGTTQSGGANGGGTVFELRRTPDGKRWSYQVLHDFCAKAHCRDGAIVEGPLVVDQAGALYGMTNVGGPRPGGLIFKLIPSANRTIWTYQVLADICPEAGNNCQNLSQANFGLTYAGASTGAVYDGTSPLYGTSRLGGLGLYGAVFRTSPRPAHAEWSVDVIHSFCFQSGCADGGFPGANVVVDEADNLFGTATWGGANGGGTLFELQKKHHTWVQTILYNFCSQTNCTDGEAPTAVTEDLAGNLIGAASTDPNSCAFGYRCDLLFQFAAGTDWSEQIIHQFCRRPDCRDGTQPVGVLATPSGSLYGATIYGGGHDADENGKGGGTIFRLDSSFDVLRRFCRRPNCADGEYPNSTIVVDSAGNIFGTTQTGGPHGAGDVFELTP